MEGLIEGRCIHYVAYNSRHLAGMVIGVGTVAGDVDLVVFTNMENVNGQKNFGVQFHQNVPHSDMKEPGTWHFIERA